MGEQGTRRTIGWGAPIAIALGLGLAATHLDGNRQSSPAAARRFDGATLQASGVVAMPKTNGVLVLDDNSANEIVWIELGEDGQQRARPVAVPLGAEIIDPEGITTDGRYVYLAGSQSKAGGPEGAGLARFTFDPGTQRVGQMESIDGLKAWLVRHVPEFTDVALPAGEDDFNIEGLAWDPPRQRLLLGLRAPVIDGHAVVVPLKVRDPRGPFNADSLQLDGSILHIALGGGGIRGIEYDDARKAFLVIAEPADGGPSAYRLLEWNGQDGAALRELAKFDSASKPEGVTRLTLPKDASLVVFDTSQYVVLQAPR